MKPVQGQALGLDETPHLLDRVRLLLIGTQVEHLHAPPFLALSDRDERNNVENIFIPATSAIAGRWRARVIAFSIPNATTPQMVHPDVVPGDGCLDPMYSAPCDFARADHQGYALVVSGSLANIDIFDGCAGVLGGMNCNNGLVDIREVVDMDIRYVNTGPARTNVVAEVSTSEMGVAFDVRSTTGMDTSIK